MKPLFRRSRSLAFAGAALWLLAACSGHPASSGATGGGAAAKTVTIGIDLPLSGADASVGISTEQGALLAIRESAHLPDGYTVRAEPLDDAVQGVHSPQQGATNVRNFVSDPSVLAVIGPYNSNVAAAEIPVTNAAGLAQIGPSVVSDGLTLGADARRLRRANPQQNTFFRVCTTDSRQGSALAQFARKLGFKTVYVVDDNETYGLDIANRFENDFKRIGGRILGHDHLAGNTQDFKSLLIKIAGTKPDAIFYGGVTSTGGGLIRKQMFDVGLGSVPFLGGDGIADLATVAGPLADGSYFTLAAPNAQRLAAARAFVKAYAARYHAPIGPYSANAYAAAEVAIHAIAQAIRANGGRLPTRAQVVEQVAKTQGLPTPIGPVSFDAAGDIENPVISLYGFKQGHPYFINQINLKTE